MKHSPTKNYLIDKSWYKKAKKQFWRDAEIKWQAHLKEFNENKLKENNLVKKEEKWVKI